MVRTDVFPGEDRMTPFDQAQKFAGAWNVATREWTKDGILLTLREERNQDAGVMFEICSDHQQFDAYTRLKVGEPLVLRLTRDDQRRDSDRRPTASDFLTISAAPRPDLLSLLIAQSRQQLSHA